MGRHRAQVTPTGKSTYQLKQLRLRFVPMLLGMIIGIVLIGPSFSDQQAGLITPWSKSSGRSTLGQAAFALPGKTRGHRSHVPSPTASSSPTSTPSLSSTSAVPSSAVSSSSAVPSSVVSSSSAVPSGSSSGSGSPGSGCYAAPSSCGYPDGSTTGVPAGVVLRSSGSLTISTPGAVVSGLDVNGCVSITASNVTLKDSYVHGNCGGGAEITTPYDGSATGIVIENVEINGNRTTPSARGISGANFTAIAVNVHDTTDAIDVQNNDFVRDSYIHDLWVASGDHTDGVQSAGGNVARVDHSTIFAGCYTCNSAIFVKSDLGPIGTFVANNNLVAGGGYTVYAMQGSGGYSSGSISYTNNRFGPWYWGPYVIQPSADGTVTWTGNINDSTGAPLAGP